MTTIINATDNITNTITNFQKNTTIDTNAIINLTNYNKLTTKELNQFLPLIKEFKKNKKSLVIVASNIDFNKVSDKITVVPTLQEAHDMIEMEEIERDLGF